MSRLTPGVRSAITLTVLVLILAGALAWGWSALTKPLPESAPTEACDNITVQEGDRVVPQQVLVSVLNAGRRSGLASRTMEQLAGAGFGEGTVGDAPSGTTVPRVQIWAPDRSHPAVRLLVSHFGGQVRVIDQETDEPGVVVVVGDGFTELVDGRQAVLARTDGVVCGPLPD